jgi:transposase
VSVVVTGEIVEAICTRVDGSPLPEEDRILIKACLRDHLRLGLAFIEKRRTVSKLLAMIFGHKTEKASRIIGRKKPKDPKTRTRGHGRKGAASYRGKTVTLSHGSLHPGDACPGCQKGKIYPTAPGVTVRIEGTAPLTATSYACEKLRCSLCGEVFAARAPGGEKYDATAGAMVALMKYGSGMPFKRLEALQESLGIPLPASTQWDIIEKNADRAHPAYRELVRQAAHGEIIHNDDTAMKVLLSINETEGRKGTFTTGVVSVKDKRTIALFFTGHHHAGENLADLLAQRHRGLGPPIQMCDALSRNVPKEFATILANCLVHARRNFVDVAENFPTECRHVIAILAKVYEHDAGAQEEEMSPQRRLAYHQATSGPLMEDLRAWMNGQFAEKKTEPNSGLGKAFSYMLKHWEPLTLFLRVAGAPIDNNICERALKMAIRHRKNSLFYRTLHGAYIGDLFMSLIHTCRLSKVNPLTYLAALQKYSHDVFKRPENWLPWNYETAIAGLPP